MTKKNKLSGLFNKSEVTGLCKRFLKDDCYQAGESQMVMYKLLKVYPSRPFWENYFLSFKLNSMFWFLGKDGQAQLARDWDLFNLDLKPQTEYKLEEVKQGEDFKPEIKTKPRTIAELLK